MNNLLNSRQRRMAAAAFAAIVVLVVIVAGVITSGMLRGSQNNQNGFAGDFANQIQVVITPEMTLTPESLPTPAFTATPVITATPEISATPALTQTRPVTPPMDLGAMPLRKCSGCLNILLMGIDQRPGDDPKTNRSDTMIILSLNTAAHTAGMLSIPRDLYVPLPGGQRLDRINTATAYGGPNYAVRTVEYNFGVPIQHYVRVNFNVVVTLVDLIGGIDVTVDQDINDQNYPDATYGYDPFVISKGLHHMDGATALKYARTRHQTSDFYRMRRQQQIILAIRDRVMSSNAIPQLLPKAPQILGALAGAISTDLSASDMVSLIMLAKDVAPDKIARLTVDESMATDWTSPLGGQVLVPNREKISRQTALLLNQPWQPERIGIRNATQTQDLAMGTRALLQGKGYTVVQATDSPDAGSGDVVSNTVIYDYYGSDQFAQGVAATLGLPAAAVSTTTGTSSKLDVLVVLGEDYRPKH